MQVTFWRSAERRYGVQVTRTESPDVVMHPAPGYDDHVPHDLVHFFVETHFGLRDGIFGQLAAGGDAHTFVDPSGSMRERRRMKARNAASGRDIARSEELAAAVHRAWVRRSADDDPELARAAAALDELAERWRALGVGGRLTLTWPWPERRSRRSA
jgi:hypothetical protein